MDVAAYATIVQAAVAVVALVISTTAVVVPWRQQRHRDQAAERERRMKARSIATALRLELNNIASELAMFAIPATTGSFAPPPVLSGQLGSQFLAYQIPIPPLLAGVIEYAYMLGDPAGPTLIRLLAIMKAYNEAVDRETTAALTGPATPAKDRWAALLGVIEDVLPKVREAIGELDPIAEDKV